MTYNSLTETIQAYLQRSDSETIAQIPNFIFLAEQKACTEIKNLGLEQYVNGVFVAGVNGGAVLQKPGRWRRTISFIYGSGTNNAERKVLQPRSYEYLINEWPNRNLMAAPQYYADYGFSHWLIAPTPDETYPFEISYMELPEPLSANVQTNWLTNYAPHVLLYGSLLQAQGFVRNLEMIPVWEKLYVDGVNALNKQDAERIYDRSTKRDSD